MVREAKRSQCQSGQYFARIDGTAQETTEKGYTFLTLMYTEKSQQIEYMT